ncbi:MAG: pyridoxal-dependent decarboxylase [Rhodobacteraceae bacterium]|nr:pyridoxal-dependent decarboxylase [Paracoccaceae bacterium]
MDYRDLSKWIRAAANWTETYYRTLDRRPVRPALTPNHLLDQLPSEPPEDPESVEAIFDDFTRLVPDGMTHWQHPGFFAYFSAMASPASILGEVLADTIACNTMLWQTSPAANEMERRMIDWFRQALGLPNHFRGLIQDGASLATLCAVLTMRERAAAGDGNQTGLARMAPLRIYASPENHSSVMKAVRVSGIGGNNLVRIPIDARRSMDPEALRAAIRNDLASGLIPAGVILCLGGTASGATDDLDSCLTVARDFDLYTHVDAAWAGSAMICPELRYLWSGIEKADSIVLNPTKLIGMQSDSSIHLLANPAEQIRAVSYSADYLATETDADIVDISSMTLPLGRRFRALKIWFHFRAYGLTGMRCLIRNHIRWNHQLRDAFRADPDFDLWITTPLALFGFTFCPAGHDANHITSRLLHRINDDGRIYLTKTMIDGRETIRVTGGTFTTSQEDVMSVYPIVREIADHCLAAS